MRGPAVLLMVLHAASASAHPQGFHQRLQLSVSQKNVDGLLVMDVDSGERAKLIRAGADFNHDGVISSEERGALQKKLTQLAVKDLKLAIAGYVLPLKVSDAKVSLRDDKTVSETGLSIALLLEAAVKSPIGEGMKLEVEAASPDQSHVLVEVSAVTGRDGGVVALDRREVTPGEKWSVRLGVLAPR